MESENKPDIHDLKATEKEFEEKQQKATPEKELIPPLFSPRTDDAAVAATGGLVGDIVTQFAQGFANGGLVGGFASHVANIQGYASGGQVASASNGNGTGRDGFYELDLRTDKGVIPAQVSENTMEGIRRSSLGGMISSTGKRPTWYS
jgi:hypothetical protein